MMKSIGYIAVTFISLALFDSVAIADDGEVIYQQTCIACHSANGKGVIPGTPDLTDTEGVLAKSDEELIANIINGYQTPGSPMAMPPKGGNPNLSEQDIRDVVEYMRVKFGK